MAEQTTKKHARELWLLGVNGCENYLLKPFDRVYYTAGTYWRNEDIFYIAGRWLTVWYRTNASERIPYEIATKYDEMAKNFYESNYSREERRAFCRELVEKMIEEYESAEATK